jgi:hypothetical protein
MKKCVLILLISIFALPASYSQFVQKNPNFPVAFDSAYGRSTSLWAAPIIADINKDGRKEIITVTDVSGGYNPFYLYVLDEKGQPIHGFPVSMSGIVCLAVGDVDGDGFLDIAVRCCKSNSNLVDVLDYKGTSLSGFPKDLVYGGSNLWPVTLYDLDGDGKLEVICGEPGKVHVFNYNGQERPGWPREVTGLPNSHPAVGDLDHDGMAEIICESYKPGTLDSGWVHVFKQDGSYFPGWPIVLDSNYLCESPSVYIDSSNSSRNFICLPLTNYFNGGRKIYKVSTTGTILNSAMVDALEFLENIAMGDLNGDGQLEFVTADQFAGYPSLHVFSNNFTLLPGWPQYGSNLIIPIILGKVIPGNKIEIVSGVQVAEPLAGFIFVYDVYGSQPEWSPFRPNGFTAGSAFTDLDNDGNADLVLITTPNKVYLHVYEIPGIPFNLQNFPWPMAYHDRYRSNQYGFVPPDEPIGIKPISNKIPAVYKLYQNYPNPFNPSTKIEFDLSQRSFVKIFIYDILGREVKSLISEYLAPGKYNIEWNASLYSSGIYFCKLQVDTNPENASLNKSFTETKKMVLVK